MAEVGVMSFSHGGGGDNPSSPRWGGTLSSHDGYMMKLESLNCNFCQKWWSTAQFFLGGLRNFHYFSQKSK